MHGYPGIGLLDAAGTAQSLSVQRSPGPGFLFPAIPETTVTLAPGTKASFWMEWINENGATVGTLEITPPNDTSQLRVPNENLELSVRSVTVSSVRAGVIARTQ